MSIGVRSSNLLLLIAISLPLVVWADACEHYWQFAPNTLVAGSKVYLKDLVEPNSNMPESISEVLARVQVARAPSVSSSLQLKASHIRSLLSYNGLRCFNIPDELIVMRAASVVKGAHVRSVVVDYIIGEFEATGIDTENLIVQVETKIEDFRIPEVKEFDARVNRIQPFLRTERLIIWVDIESPAGTIRTLQMIVRLQLNEEVWTARNSLNIGDEISLANLDRKFTNNVTGTFVATDRKIYGHTVIRRVAQGSVVHLSDIREATLIKKGEWYFASIETGAVHLQVKVQALTPADKGQIFRAKRATGEELNVMVDKKGYLWVKM